jgi:hypothetical protein
MKKRAEMTTQQIVILIVLIASFAVILFFFSKLGLGNESQKELCHNSVVMRANMPLGGDSIPLNCKREYVCLTEDGSCEALTNPVKYKVKTEEEVYEVLADELADCWWMFGEGKIDYVGKDGFSKLYCSYCSQIAFDDSVKKIFDANEFDKKSFWDYMASLKKENGETYTEYLYDTNNFEEFFLDTNGGVVNLDKQYFALMGIASSTSTWTWAGIGAAAVVVGTVTAGTGGVAVLAVAAGSGAVVGATALAPVAKWSESGNKFVLPWLIEVNSEEYEQIGCSKITTLS